MHKKHLLALLTISTLTGGPLYAAKMQDSMLCNSLKTTALKEAMRKLWSDHVIWTREFIVAAVDGAENTNPVKERLLKNQEDIGNAIIPYYGKDAGKKLTALLKDHIAIAAEVVGAAKMGNKETLADADKRWHANADDIAQFLSKANPHWSFAALKDMLYEHLKLTTQEAVAHIKKQWTADIKAFDAVFPQALLMADMLSNGIIKQFPAKF